MFVSATFLPCFALLRNSLNLRYRLLGRMFVALIAGLMTAQAAYAHERKKTDTVWMKNGDRITCEIESLEQGQLTIKQSYALSSIAIDWREVDHVESNQPFVVTDASGQIYSGVVSQSVGKTVVNVEGEANAAIPHEMVVSIEETGATFWRKMRGDIDIGWTAQKSNSQKNLTLDSDVRYQARSTIMQATANSQFTSQLRAKNTSETNVKSEYFRQSLKTNWYSGAIANFLSSSEQAIDLRTTLGGALANRPIYTNKTQLELIGGLGYTIERDSQNISSQTDRNSVDASLAAQFSTFRFDAVNWDTTLWVYPSLSDLGHVRATLNQDVYFKFYKDFYIRASFYDNYDNHPLIGTPSNNLGITTSFGWSFR